MLKNSIILLKSVFKDPQGFLSLSFIFFIFFISIFAYMISPDDSQNANNMSLSIHSKPPFFKTTILKIPNQSKNLNAPSLDNLKQLAELNASQRAVLDQRANRFAFDQGLATPEDMLNKIRPLDKSGIFGFFGNEANLQDIVDFYRNNPTTQI